MYNDKFISLVNFANSNQLSEIEMKNGNPNYIGFGNPNSNILIFGKEKAIDENQSHYEKILFNESLNNPNEWKQNIDENYFLTKEKLISKEGYISSFYPYSGKNKSGHTWSKYQSLINLINGKENTITNEFFFDCFISEINHLPSKISQISKFKDNERIQFLKSDFYKSFDIVVLTCANYLSKSQIEEIFEVKCFENSSKKREKLVIYKSDNRIVINTRQLSMDVSNEYLIRLSEKIKK